MTAKQAVALQNVENALKVFLTDPKIRKFLDENDPKSVEQATKALKGLSCFN